MLEVIRKATFKQGENSITLDVGQHKCINYSPEEGGYLAVEFEQHGWMKLVGGCVRSVR